MLFSPIEKIPLRRYICNVDLKHQILELIPLDQNFKIKIPYDNINLTSQEHIVVHWSSSKQYKFSLCLLEWGSIDYKRVTYVPVY